MEQGPMTLARTLAVAGLPTLILAGAARAQQPLVADRPDFTEGPITVGLGAAQIELGYTFGRDRGGPTVTTHSLGEPLVRLGVLAEWLELRVGTGLVARRTQINGGGLTKSGFEDLYVGFKLALSEQNGAMPALGILPQATFPTGSDPFSSGQVLPGLNLVYSWDVAESFSLAGGTQVNRAVGESGDAVAEWAQSLSGGIGLGDRHGLFCEWFAVFDGGPGGMQAAEHYANTGLTWLLMDDLQWDIRVGVGLNDRAEDVFFGTGFALRLHGPQG
ncbi:MAG: transporter [Gemmatimonadetes bacterium]|nr:transporter [Gemmatimonadota bacterium]MYE70064.1 transporter [Gemmatimonadota bacterium]MYJ70047.1 transporter [Gemmatimonadota bacterium]